MSARQTPKPDPERLWLFNWHSPATARRCKAAAAAFIVPKNQGNRNRRAAFFLSSELDAK